eukprot:m.107273 g.107273  ORF g.107273 m.107273 type:complete len:641 (-) comp22570_c1_seq1:682-2604(-)
MGNCCGKAEKSDNDKAQEEKQGDEATEATIEKEPDSKPTEQDPDSKPEKEAEANEPSVKTDDPPPSEPESTEATTSAAPPPPPPPPPVPTTLVSHPSMEDTFAGLPPPPPPPLPGSPSAKAATRIQARIRGYLARKSAYYARSMKAESPIKEDHKLNFAEAVPIVDLATVNWAECVSVQRSAGGMSSGVYFVSFPENRVVIVKPDADLAADILGTTLGHFLGANCPNMRLLKTNEPEGRQLYHKLCAIDEKQKEKAGVAEALAMPFLLIQSFVKGTTLRDICFQSDDQKKAWAEQTFGPEGKLSEPGKRRLREIGCIMAFDILVHNHDRLPSVWDNQGNTENLMFNSEHNPVAIDSMVSCFDPEVGKKSFDLYLSRVEDLIGKLTRNPEDPHSSITRVRDLFLKGRGTMADEGYCPPLCYDIGEEGVREIQAGVIGTTSRIEWLNRSVLDSLREGVMEDIQDEITDLKTYGMERINVNFLTEVGDVFRRRGKKPKRPFRSIANSVYMVVNWGNRNRNVSVYFGDGSMETPMSLQRESEKIKTETIKRRSNKTRKSSRRRSLIRKKLIEELEEEEEEDEDEAKETPEPENSNKDNLLHVPSPSEKVKLRKRKEYRMSMFEGMDSIASACGIGMAIAVPGGQ